MEIIIKQNPDEVCKYVAHKIAETIKEKPDAVMALAAGSTMLGTYRELIRLHREDGLDFSKVIVFGVDEYVGLAKDHPCSYHAIMRTSFYDHVNIRPKNIFIPDGMASDIQQETSDYEAKIKELGGLDICALGISEDGHIGFNEPSSSLASRTRIKMLTEKTRYERSRFFPDGNVPRHVITMGIGTILDSKNVLLAAFGSRKSEVISKVVEGPVTAMVPASALQMHQYVKVVVDDEAAKQLKMRDYYRWAFEDKI